MLQRAVVVSSGSLESMVTPEDLTLIQYPHHFNSTGSQLLEEHCAGAPLIAAMIMKSAKPTVLCCIHLKGSVELVLDK